MSSHRMIRVLTVALASATLSVLAAGAGAAQAAASVKLTLNSQFGREVNLTQAGNGPELEDLCTVASKDECQPGAPSNAPGGFQSPESVAAAPSGDVYVADHNGGRVQELTASGQFVLMFGREVNETKGTDVCTHEEEEAEAVQCKAGVQGGAPGQFYFPFSVAVDPASGDVYVAEIVEVPGAFGERVQKFTAQGQFLLEIGKEVNETTHGNLCTHEEEVKEAVKCTGPAVRNANAPYIPEPGSFNFPSQRGDLLAVGPEGELYVGDDGRVQEFKETGESSGEVPLAAGISVQALAVDESGDLYLTDSPTATTGNIVRVFDAEGNETSSFAVSPEEPGDTVHIIGLALDAEGHLAVLGVQETPSNVRSLFGSFFEASSGRALTTFKVPPGRYPLGIGFDSKGELYVATGESREILVYSPEPVGEFVTSPAGCVPGAERETDATFDCTLGGEVDPEGISETEAWFEWGGTPALGERTAGQQVSASGPVPAAITLRPNASVYYRVVGEDANVKAPEELTGERSQVTTPLVAPEIPGAPSASFATPSSAVLSSELNPENASAEYFFEYAQGEAALAGCPGVRSASCPGVASTAVGHSAVYGAIGTTLEARGLQPDTRYSYRLAAENEGAFEAKKLTSIGPIGSFTTPAAPAPSAQTGAYSALTATSATVSATVDPDGAPVTYSFELGVYDGAETQYGSVSSGTVQPDSGPVEETLALSGLQPGTTYAYRIAISSGYIDSETHTLQGQPVTFTTGGLPAVLQAPAELGQLPTPSIAFPAAVSTATGKQPAGAGRKNKKAKAKKKKREKGRGRRKKGRGKDAGKAGRIRA
jgi:hypothetical protein